jgi:NAD(P)-dependent dehydrogenase (short-subunit alcohol dehydrogenase family)
MPNEPFIDFQGKRIIVTGASSGIGRAIAIELGRRGASLVLIGRNESEIEKTFRTVPGKSQIYHLYRMC